MKPLGPRLPVQSKNLRSVSENPDLVQEKIFKEIDLGRVAGPFDYPPMPTFRVSPIFLVVYRYIKYPTWQTSNRERDTEVYRYIKYSTWQTSNRERDT